MLLLVLPSFLEETRWQGDDDVDRRVRMRLALRLAWSVARMPELAGFDTVAAVDKVKRAWRAANRRLRQERGQRALERMSPESRSQMESFIAQVEARRAAESSDSH